VTARKHPPLLTRSGLTGTVFVVTRYTLRDNGLIEAHEKYDVTDQFGELVVGELEADDEIRISRRAAEQIVAYEGTDPCCDESGQCIMHTYGDPCPIRHLNASLGEARGEDWGSNHE